MNVLVINCGSSSLKYQLFDMAKETVLAKGLVERIGLEGSCLTHRVGEDKTVIEQNIPDHQAAISLVLEQVRGLGEIKAVGHRVVHGGEKFSASTVIDAEVLKAIEECVELAPLHNPPNIIGIKACQALLPGVPQVAVFDTAFHQTMPPKAYIYSLPYEYYEKYRIRRYGFHGTSHRYVAQRAAQLLGKPLDQLKLITCHLGNGASITAIDGGKSVATSMGFTPLEGLTMGTRSGDIDPAIVSYIMEKENLTAEQVTGILNKKSGVLGISGVSSDFRDLEAAAARGHERARLALEIFCYDVKKYIGAYLAVLNGVDAIVFTAGLGENSSVVREMVCRDLEALGIAIDAEKNQVRGQEADISAPSARVKVLVVPTNEELMIARDTVAVLAGK
ncbi:MULTISPECIES: acetate/propionate family kinase [Carboxydocella]|uniref:Acetate kinase n=2 Tax=Carboxydocella TaxID=178898 RepID=A0A1T4N7W8_9FIRM|nr:MULTISPECIES: acetate kinase [Carboxydocella]AVX20939.1 acetate kinase [Carboxydocella thermautotrophica]GAW29898.1 acetate kinase [Carboxydocella sp. ULO1]GAW30500.1 acetate kinase [Carboxydocella sp. JDF658]SJZ75273.1 acetate kinase [Carboxydocella sporoproducens DSM 16521]